MKVWCSHDECLTIFSESAFQYAISITDEREVVEELVGVLRTRLTAMDILSVNSMVTGDGIAGSSL